MLNNCIPVKNVIVTIIDVQPAVILFNLNTNETIEYINIINDITIDIRPNLPTNCKGLLEKPIIPLEANFSILFKGYFVLPANLFFLS